MKQINQIDPFKAPLKEHLDLVGLLRLPPPPLQAKIDLDKLNI